jgi:hypothetical protein
MLKLEWDLQKYFGFEVFTEVVMKSIIFWDILFLNPIDRPYRAYSMQVRVHKFDHHLINELLKFEPYYLFLPTTLEKLLLTFCAYSNSYDLQGAEHFARVSFVKVRAFNCAAILQQAREYCIMTRQVEGHHSRVQTIIAAAAAAAVVVVTIM